VAAGADVRRLVLGDLLTVSRSAGGWCWEVSGWRGWLAGLARDPGRIADDAAPFMVRQYV